MVGGSAPSEWGEVRGNGSLLTDRRPIPLYHVVLLDDDDHTIEYVLDMLHRVFGFPHEEALNKALEVDEQGRATLETTTRERAEFKQEQVHAFGPDRRLSRCQGSMTCILEPAD